MFAVQGEKRRSCIFDKTPSASDPDCVKLRQSDASLKDSKKTIHLFSQSKKLLTTW
jgi:hypothetical protein